MVSGLAVTAAGKPFANGILGFGNLQASVSPTSPYPPGAMTLETDANGRFQWDVPDEYYPHNGYAPPITCWAMPEDTKRWTYTIELTPAFSDVYSRRDVLNAAVQTCDATWTGPDSNRVLKVTVPDSGMVTLQVKDSKGSALAKRPVDVWSMSRASGMSGQVVFHGQTDANGLITTRWFAGDHQIRLLVPDQGFGATTLLPIVGGQTLRPVLPPLVPLAELSGTASVNRKAGSMIAANASDFEQMWYARYAGIDAQNHWSISDVLPGSYTVTFKEGDPDVGTYVTVQPGDHRSGIVVGPKAAPVERLPFKGNAPVVTGKVTDAAGTPIVGATVYVVYYYQAMVGAPYKKGVAVKTGDSGSYEAHAPSVEGPSIDCIRVAAVYAGYGVSERAALILSGSEPAPSIVRADIVLPPQNTELSIKVLQDGKPLPGAAVALYPENAAHDRDDKFLNSVDDAVNDKLCGFLNPTAVTGGDGVATFKDIFPGLWDIRAASDEASLNSDYRSDSDESDGSYNAATAVIVRAGLHNSFKIRLLRQSRNVTLRPLRPNGSLLKSQRIGLESDRGQAKYGGLLFPTLDRTGAYDVSMSSTGLWKVSPIYRDVPLDPDTMRVPEPLYAANALIAVSPSVGEPAALSLVPRMNGTASLRVQVLSPDGKPEPGAVKISCDPNAYYVDMTENTNSHGTAEFNGLPSGKYTVSAGISGKSTGPMLITGDIPPVDSLTNLWQLTPQDVTLSSGLKSAVTLHVQPVSYVRGKFPIPGSYYRTDSDGAPQTVAVVTNPTTGEFVAGPFLPGRVDFVVQRWNTPPAGPGEDSPEWRITANASQDRVALATVETHAPDPDHLSLWMGEVYDGNRQVAFDDPILLSDGKTPAWGARLAFFVPEQWRPIMTRRADAAGLLTDNEDSAPYGEPDVKPADSPDKPVVIAWLPGSNGVAIVPFVASQKTHIVLPPPISLHGCVTVGGKPVDGIDSSFRILAAYQGRGNLNSWLSIDATAQADGTFDLAGLTPGTYIVQASRDNVWDSPAQTIVVGEKSLPVMTLNIPSPGMAVNLTVLDKSGRPIPGAQIHLPAPAGPISDTKWPNDLTTDGAGRLHIEGLDAGAQVITVFPPQSVRDEGGHTVKPLGTLTLQVPVNVKGSPALEATVHCGTNNLD
jgi:protocatechuate 3,4-dioxygenase beta subunit